MVFALDVIGWLAGTSPTPASTGIPSGIPKWIEESPFWSQYLSQIVGWVTIAILTAAAAAVWKWRIPIADRIRKFWNERLMLRRRPKFEAELSEQYAKGVEAGRTEFLPSSAEQDLRIQLKVARARVVAAEKTAEFLTREVDSGKKIGRTLHHELQTAERSLSDTEQRFEERLKTEVAAALKASAEQLAATEEQLRSAKSDAYARAQQEIGERAYSTGFQEGRVAGNQQRSLLEEELRVARMQLDATRTSTDYNDDGSLRRPSLDPRVRASEQTTSSTKNSHIFHRASSWRISPSPTHRQSDGARPKVWVLTNSSTVPAHDVRVDGGVDFRLDEPEGWPSIPAEHSALFAGTVTSASGMVHFRIRWTSDDGSEHSTMYRTDPLD
ncbi:hypothetical protein [Rathayibacter sp. VKM Ac-2630]|uniref:hypothetical protein n=1 Tax=Rathayibacter sp. VKM Ac-2630 TaxID=1938617 RepID=UPI0011158B15|nr:hypothetical protein [Rathayibacter sp. VKM Ac-2630]